MEEEVTMAIEVVEEGDEEVMVVVMIMEEMEEAVDVLKEGEEG